MADNENNQNTEPKEEAVEVKTYTQEEVDNMKNQMKQEYEKTFDDKFNKRWGREKSNLEKSRAKENELINLIKEQTGKDNIKDLLEFTYEQYGVEKPKETKDSRDDEILGRYDAKEFLDTDDYSEIEFEANRLAQIPNRNAREQSKFMELAGYLNNKKLEAKREKEIEESGIDKELLKNQEFVEYMKNFKDDTPLKFIYENYSKTKPQKEKPFSAGSLTGTNVEDKSKIKDYYTYEESLQFTRKDYDNNPELWKVIQDSATKWGKK